MPKRVKKTVIKRPVIAMKEPTEFMDGPMVPENSVIEVDSKGVGDVVEGPAPVATSRAVEAGEAPEPVPAHVVVEREDDMKLLGDQAELIKMAARIAELEDQNKELAARPLPAAQGLITVRKNPGEDIVQRTSGGNIRTTHDPSPQLREEMDTQEVKAV